MKKYQDIQINDLSLRMQFTQLWMNGNYADALSILKNSPQLNKKAFMASCFNLMIQAIVLLENNFYQGVTEEFQILLSDYNDALDEFRQKSFWDNTLQYRIGNFVIYQEAVYVCIKDNINVAPTNTQYWVYLGLRGSDGAYGINVNLKYQWNSSAVYQIDDVVLYGNIMYIATSQNVNNPPPSFANIWKIFLPLPIPKIIISAIEPPNELLYDGLVWWQILD